MQWQYLFSCTLLFRGYEFHSRESPRREGIFPGLRPSLITEKQPSHRAEHLTAIMLRKHIAFLFQGFVVSKVDQPSKSQLRGVQVV